MEKFTKWEDKSNGINPFVPYKQRPRAVPKAILGFILAPFKLILLLLVAILVLLGLALEKAVVVKPARALVRLVLLRPLVFFALKILGFWSIHEAMPDTRRLRLGELSKKGTAATENAMRKFGRTVRSGDAILFNSTSVMEVLYLYARFAADFAVPSLPDGQGFMQVGLLGALRRAAFTGENPAQAPCNGGKALVSELQANAQFPIAVFAEGARTNGRALIEFVPAIGKDTNLIDGHSRVHFAAFAYSYKIWSPCNTVNGLLKYLWQACTMFNNSMIVNVIPYEVWTAERKNKGNQETDLRSLLASAVGKRGVKQVALTHKVYFDFLLHFHKQSPSTSGSKAKAQ
mmetsp:Transcript_12858/g.20951  ORF Transcript_12858/g.20951 Transcript_12858/m.20951 type:complete len:345 (-) Transcript_12858:242-1276(-)|eukprot:CAMPEP_0171494780 /NCGR_PEP_ID=MMETSP0958-20121227/5751_1 /TAXON_ID=87120 /ORGANISM="Aurantiochytrium limacinum, Strain ATCCMYA-1381" /LENGTH=344 /DNA_ID=CAMNT_0012028639 /DNA_START=54 /DNA_END=1088 /DNA_ORIENTATION=+